MVSSPRPLPPTHCNPECETQAQWRSSSSFPTVPEEGHSPSECSVGPTSRGMTSNGKTPLSPTMREPRREQIQVSSLSVLSRDPQDSLSLLSRRQAAAAPRFRRADWEPPAPPRSSRATAVRNRSLRPAMPQPGQGHPGMPRAEKHQGHLRELLPLAEHLFLKCGILTSWSLRGMSSTLLCAWPWAERWAHRAKGAQLLHTPLQEPHIFSLYPAPDCVSACPPEAKLSLMTG